MLAPIIAVAIILGWTLYSVYCLLRNIRRAQRIGIPYHVIPASPVNPLWILFEPLIFFILDRIPLKFGRINHYGRRTWQFVDKAQSHLQMGDVWAIVSPSEVFVYVCDAGAITDILARRTEFVRPLELYTLLNVFGPNVATTAGTDWQRHRKILAAPFNETMNSFVWREAILQAQGMLTTRVRGEVSGGLGIDSRNLALNVLAATGFKRSTPFRSTCDAEPEDPRSFAESLRTVMLNTFLIMLIPPAVLKMRLLPAWCRRAGQAVEDFKQHMLTMFKTEKALLEQGKPGTGTLMSSFVRESTGGPGSSKTVLTLEEILGNIYVINFAGHDTTGGTLAYVLFLLSAFPNIQDWIAEEIRIVFSNPDHNTWEYKDAFPRLKRCLAVVLETVRLYPPILALPKSVATPIATLRLPETGRTLTLPKKTILLPSILATQMHPKYWPDEPNIWNPRRWIEIEEDMELSNCHNSSLDSRLAREKIMEPHPGVYLPWSSGVQNCPGRKFAQVEIVVVVATLLREHRLRVELLEKEDFEKAQARLLKCTNDSYQLLVMQMKNADSMKFYFERVQ